MRYSDGELLLGLAAVILALACLIGQVTESQKKIEQKKTKDQVIKLFHEGIDSWTKRR